MQHKCKTYKEDNKVTAVIPRIDHSSTTLKHIPYKIGNVKGKKQNSYQLQSSHGIISKCYPGWQLQPFTGEVDTSQITSETSQISLQETVIKVDPKVV